MEDTPENRQVFKSRDFTWTDELRRREWFMDTKAFSSDTNKKLEAARVARKAFVTAVDHNIVSSVGRPFPLLRVPYWFHLIPFDREPKVTQARKVADLTGPMIEFIKGRSGSPHDLDWPEGWVELLARG